jgi:hypothetical protein
MIRADPFPFPEPQMVEKTEDRPPRPLSRGEGETHAASCRSQKLDGSWVQWANLSANSLPAWAGRGKWACASRVGEGRGEVGAHGRAARGKAVEGHRNPRRWRVRGARVVSRAAGVKGAAIA